MAKEFSLTQRVKYIRLSPEGEPVRGEGQIVGKIIGINKRINYCVKDEGKAYTLEPLALDCTEEEEAAYIAHAKKIRAVADDYNKRSQDIITEGNKVIDDLNTEFFGPQVID